MNFQNRLRYFKSADFLFALYSKLAILLLLGLSDRTVGIGNLVIGG